MFPQIPSIRPFVLNISIRVFPHQSLFAVATFLNI
jgi:hypothetical protein